MDVSTVNLLPSSSTPNDAASSALIGYVAGTSGTPGSASSNLLASATDLLSSVTGADLGASGGSGGSNTNATAAALQHLAAAAAAVSKEISSPNSVAHGDGAMRHSQSPNSLNYRPDDQTAANASATISDRLASNAFLIKNEIVAEHDRVLTSNPSSNVQTRQAMQSMQSGGAGRPVNAATGGGASALDASLMQIQQSNLHNVSSLHRSHLMSHFQMQQPQATAAAANHPHLFPSAEFVVAAAAAAAGGADPRHHLHYNPSGLGGPSMVGSTPDCMSTQKAVAFLAGPRERIHVLGNPVEHCPRCQQEGLGTTGWRPHRHIGELKIRYICERHFDDLESNHHFDIPLCPICNQVLYLYDFNNMLGVSNARRLHKYVLKCANRHVLPLLDLFCQTKKGGERCNANFKLQWCYGTMVKRCEAQKNRDHDLWWVRYKNEWKQRRTIIRYKKDFLSHLTDAQRSLLLGLGLEGEPPPDPKSALGPTFDALVSSVSGSPSGPKLKKRTLERLSQMDDRLSAGLGDMNPAKQRFRSSTNNDFTSGNLSMADYSAAAVAAAARQSLSTAGARIPSRNDGLQPSESGPRVLDDPTADPLRYVMGAVVLPSRNVAEDPNNQLMVYLRQQQQHQQHNTSSSLNGQQRHTGTPNYSNSSATQNMFTGAAEHLIPSHSIITGTPTPPLPSSGTSPVAVSVVGEVIPAPVVT